MKNIDDQTAYWNSVAATKTFTHPFNATLIKPFLNTHSKILDYGCGYGRLSAEIYQLGYRNITGVDTSIELINRGNHDFPALDLIHIKNADTIPFEENSLDLVLLFAVLTCIPSNNGQNQLISVLYSKLKKGGLLYVSDYYLQNGLSEVREYSSLGDDSNNFGVFTLSEGVTFRHHTKEWISSLLQHFEIITEESLPVKTMNGNTATAFQIICRK